MAARAEIARYMAWVRRTLVVDRDFGHETRRPGVQSCILSLRRTHSRAMPSHCSLDSVLLVRWLNFESTLVSRKAEV